MDSELNCIKGGGACHLREKVLAEAAETCVRRIFMTISIEVKCFLPRFIVVADYRKKSKILGSTVRLISIRYSSPF